MRNQIEFQTFTRASRGALREHRPVWNGVDGVKKVWAVVACGTMALSCAWVFWVVQEGGDPGVAALAAAYIVLLSAPMFVLQFDFTHILLINMPAYLLIAIAFAGKALEGGALSLFYVPYADPAGAKRAILLTLFISIVGEATLYSAFALSVTSRSREERLFRFEPQHHCVFAIGLSIVLALIGYGVLVWHIGSFSVMFGEMRNRVKLYEGMNYFVQAVHFMTVATILALLTGYRKLSLWIFGCAAALLATLGGRGGVVFGLIIPYMIAWHLLVGKLGLKRLAVCAVAIFIFGLVWLEVRERGQVDWEGLARLANPVELVLAPVRYEMQQGLHHEITSGLVYLLTNGSMEYNFGRTFLNLFYAPIPRSVWPNKPAISEDGIIAYALTGDKDQGLPPGLFGLAFFHFHIVGVIVFGVIAGVVTQRFHGRLIGGYLKRGAIPPVGNVLVYTVLFSNFPGFLHVEALTNLLCQAAYVLMIIIVCCGGRGLTVHAKEIGSR